MKNVSYGRKCLLRPKMTIFGRKTLTAEISVMAEYRLSLRCILQLRNFGKNPLSVTHYERQRRLCFARIINSAVPHHRTAESRQPEKLACVGVGTFSLNIRNFYVRLCLLNHFVPYLLQNNISASPEIGLQISISP